VTRADVIRAELKRIRDRVPAWLEAEGAPRGRFHARELDRALQRHGYTAPATACRMLRRMRGELGVRCVDRARGLYEISR